MAQNLVSRQFSDQDIAALDAALAVVERVLGGRIELSADQGRWLSTMGDRSEAFGRQTMVVLGENRQILPAGFDFAEAGADLRSLDLLRPRFARFRRLAAKAEDTEMALSSDIMSFSLDGDAVAKVFGKGEALETLKEAMSSRLARRRKPAGGGCGGRRSGSWRPRSAGIEHEARPAEFGFPGVEHEARPAESGSSPASLDAPLSELLARGKTRAKLETSSSEPEGSSAALRRRSLAQRPPRSPSRWPVARGSRSPPDWLSAAERACEGVAVAAAAAGAEPPRAVAPCHGLSSFAARRATVPGTWLRRDAAQRRVPGGIE